MRARQAASTDILWTHLITPTGSDTALLAVTLVGRDGKRRYDSQSKRRLIEACLQPGVSVAGLALKAGVNANLLRRWIKLHEQRRRAAGVPDIVDDATTLAVPSAFVTVREAGRGEVVERTSISEPRLRACGHRSGLALATDGGDAQRDDAPAGLHRW